MRRVIQACLILGASILPTARADDFVLVQAEDPKICSVEGRVETHIYPRSVGRKMAMLHPGSRLTTTTELRVTFASPNDGTTAEQAAAGPTRSPARP